MTWYYPQKIETAARVHMAELITHARRLDDRKDTYTPKGMTEAWTTATARIAEQITALEINVNATAAAVDAVGEFYRARVMPPAPAALDAALEATVTRIMARPARDGLSWLIDLVAELKGETALDAVARELIAHGRYSAEDVEAALVHVSEEYAAALEAAQVIKTWHAHIGTAWITELKMCLQSMEYALAHEQAPHELQQLRAADILAPLGDPAAVAIADSGEIKPAPSAESVETAESTAAEAG